MSLVLANNVGALNAQHNLNRTSTALNRSLERLSSGLKVNRGADGPAALVISEKQRAQIAGLRQAIDNGDKAVSVVQTAEGALNEINSLLVKIRMLALDSANSGVNDDDAMAANQAEISNALDTINRIANNTQFGTKRLLDGTAAISAIASDSDVTVLKTSNDTVEGVYAVAITTAGERANVTAGTEQTGNLAAAETLRINGVDITLAEGLSKAQVISRINEFTSQTGVVAEVGAGDATRLRTIAFGEDASIAVVSDTAAAATSSGFGTTELTDDGVDIVGTIGGLAATGKGNVLTATTGSASGLSIQLAQAVGSTVATVNGAQGEVRVTDNSLVFQIGANQNQTVKLGINRVNAGALGVGVSGSQFAHLGEIDVQSAGKAQDTLAIVDRAIDEITNLRGMLGAFQHNTLEATSANLRTTLENTVNAESVIRDTNYAEEVSNFTRQQVLMQAGTSVLSSASQTSHLVLSLLG